MHRLFIISFNPHDSVFEGGLLLSILQKRNWVPERPMDFPKDWPLTICPIQHKTKTRGPLFKKYWQFHDGDDRALNLARSPSGRGALCPALAHTQSNPNTNILDPCPSTQRAASGETLSSGFSQFLSQALGWGKPPCASHSLCRKPASPTWVLLLLQLPGSNEIHARTMRMSDSREDSHELYRRWEGRKLLMELIPSQNLKKK